MSTFRVSTCTHLNVLASPQTIVRGSFVGHGDYISHVIAEMSRLSVSSSNSLRRSSLSARKRAQSLGRLGELVENESYEYDVLGKTGSSTYWQDRIQQARSEGGSPKLNVALQRAKSICEMGSLSEATPPVSTPTGVTGEPGGQYAQSDGAGLRQGPISHLNSLQESNRPNVKVKPAVGHLPDLLSSSGKTPRRPRSSCDLKVRRGVEHSSFRSLYC